LAHLYKATLNDNDTNKIKDDNKNDDNGNNYIISSSSSSSSKNDKNDKNNYSINYNNNNYNDNNDNNNDPNTNTNYHTNTNNQKNSFLSFNTTHPYPYPDPSIRNSNIPLKKLYKQISIKNEITEFERYKIENYIVSHCLLSSPTGSYTFKNLNMVLNSCDFHNMKYNIIRNDICNNIEILKCIIQRLIKVREVRLICCIE
jgi:hypothetical protein